MTVMKKAIGVLCIWIFFSGCAKELAFVNSDQFNEEKMRTIEKGVTLKKDLIEMFGKPENTISLENKETLFYKDNNLKSLWIELDENDLVRDFVFSKK